MSISITRQEHHDEPRHELVHDTAQWFAAYTCPRHEKLVARYMTSSGIDCLLPLYRSVRRWKDRRKTLDLPLFPGYVFLQISLRDRLRVLEAPGVVNIVSFNGRPAPIPDSEVEVLRRGFGTDGVRPHPFIKVGRKVRVRTGPMTGLEGVLVRKKDRCRLVLSINLIQRAVCVEVDEEAVVAAC